MNFDLILVLLIAVVNQSYSWIPQSARGNLWQRSPFLLPPRAFDPDFFVPPNPNAVPIFGKKDVPDRFQPPTPPAPIETVNATQVGDKLFNAYFKKNKLDEIDDLLEYFRHDLGVNLFHYFWHAANPFDGNLVYNHRRGESFYFMHAQLMARYNTERIANGEGPIKSIHNEIEIEHDLQDKYKFPKFDVVGFDQMCHDSYTSMQKYTNNIIEAINKGYAETMQGKKVPLTVDVLGNMIQPSSLSPNYEKYGSSHNMGHYNIAYCHFLGNKKLSIPMLGDLGDTRTAPRCPVFYRFHTYINDVFELQANNLPEYTKEDLDFPELKMHNIKTIGENGTINHIETFWKKILTDNLYKRDFLTQEYDRDVHIQHEDFNYELEVENTSDETKKGTIRIFLVAKNDASGKQMPLSAQRNLFIELDKFVAEFQPGNNTITRDPEHSPVTLKFDETFRELIKGQLGNGEPQNFCACGWPDYFLLPRGSTDGMTFQLFAMVSDYTRDSAEKDTFNPPNPQALEQKLECKEAYSYCGKMESIYPDRAPMGYPWDRPAPHWAENLKDFLTPNMAVQEIVIQHNNKTVDSIVDKVDPNLKPRSPPPPPGAAPPSGPAEQEPVFLGRRDEEDDTPLVTLLERAAEPILEELLLPLQERQENLEN